MTEVALIAGNEETREVLRALLRLHHHRVRAEGRGTADAQRLLKSGFKGVLFVDAELSDGSWVDILQSARESEPSVPTVLVSPFYGAEFEEKAHKLGVGAILLRPFEIPELLDAIARVDPAPDGGGRA
jgi:DNA-binding NtrC family response regulator